MINIENLEKRRKQHTILEAVNLHARPGRITAFLGANGAGKSSTLRILLGLDQASNGTATIAGQQYHNLKHPLHVVGAVLDGSGAHPSRKGIDHLRWVTKSNRIPPSRIAEVLSLVGLEKARHQQVGKYSLGMGRRLGIATALLGQPEILILDEPTNGLDPAGIRWLRELLRNHAHNGGTVLLSSHLMAEVEDLADDVTIIATGRTIAAGTLQQVRGKHEHLEQAFFALSEDNTHDNR